LERRAKPFLCIDRGCISKNGCNRHIAGVSAGQMIGHTLEIVIVPHDDGPVAGSRNLRTEGLPASFGITTGREKVKYAFRQLGKHMQIWRIDAIFVDNCQDLLRNIIRHLPLLSN